MIREPHDLGDLPAPPRMVVDDQAPSAGDLSLTS
jgi:hypothetical protein